VDAFQWFLHLIAELEHIHHRQRSAANTDQAKADWNRFYCEIHMFVTRAPKEKLDPVPEMKVGPKTVSPNEAFPPQFSVTDLYAQVSE
jgi:hypothetical protein